MPQPAPGVVSHKKGEPVSVKTIVIANPGRGEAGVQVQACGVCHTDLHYCEGGITNELRLGHETVGVVEQVGQGVAEVAPGDYDLAGAVALVAVADPEDDGLAAAAGRLRGAAGRSSPLGTATACPPGSSSCSSTRACSGAAAGESRRREDRPRRRRGGVPPDGAGRGPALGGDAVTDHRGDHPVVSPDRTSPTASVYPPTSEPIDQVLTSGMFSLDGGTWAVDNNVWIVGDESKVIDRRRARR
jgi:hypothetical protein